MTVTILVNNLKITIEGAVDYDHVKQVVKLLEQPSIVLTDYDTIPITPIVRPDYSSVECKRNAMTLVKKVS